MTNKLFETDLMSKRERVEATLNHRPVDRVAILEQLSFNPRVIELYTGRKITGFDYTLDDICEVIRKTTDMIMPPVAPRGTGRITDADGFVQQRDNWTSWRVSRPFDHEHGARDWLIRVTKRKHETPFDAATARQEYQADVLALQKTVGDTVILKFSHTGMCGIFDAMGLEIFTFFLADYEEVFAEYMQVSTEREVARIHAVADAALSPVILIPEDFATKHGPIFPPLFLNAYHYPNIRKLSDAWHEHGVKVLYHSDGNWRTVIPDLIETGADGFYCLEPNCGMDIVEFKNTWPQMVWSGGVDGVDLLERGTPDQVREEVRRQIVETLALETGGMFVASSSEINPPISPENFKAMIEAVGENCNPSFLGSSPEE